ncbi:hypothetical protein ABZ135_21285 [Streptomyces sp. NPDC006339]|uniref:hypothetical protein n=1 Tax=Streptomyces sp. NPDC006339 TaxID=3156755 RepID=UPI0033BF08B9
MDDTLALLLKGDGRLMTHLLGRPVRVLEGPEAVAFFPDERHARRGGAPPGPSQEVLP